MDIAVNLMRGRLHELRVDMVAVGVTAPNDDGGRTTKHGRLAEADGGVALDKVLNGWLSGMLAYEDFKGAVGTSKMVPVPTGFGVAARYILLVGYGPAEALALQDMRIIGAKVGQAAECYRLKSVGGILVNATLRGMTPAERLQAVIEGLRLGTYEFTRYKTEVEPPSLKSLTFIAAGNRTALEKAAQRAAVVADAVCFARDLVNTTAAELPPLALVEEARHIAKSHNLGIKVFTGKALKRERMHLVVAVGRGSPNPPAFVHLSYKPRSKARRRIALVGKGITFDTGGLDLKPSAAMLTMKDDMSGAAAVLGAICAIARLKPPVAVDVYIPIAENAIDGKAQRPSDVVKSRNGKTVEISNTDAEGRLVLADALDYAVEHKPDIIVDVATLTGGIVVALGEQCVGVFSNREELAKKMLVAADRAGELMWHMPLLKVYEDGLKSGVADLSSLSKSKASSVTAALFLKQFVKNTPWVHLDIAGAAWTSDPLILAPVGGTGAATRTLVEFCLG